MRPCPSDIPTGGHDEFSTYLHLVLCPLEHAAMTRLVGDEAASAVRSFWQDDHYRWIYRTVEQDWEALTAVLHRHGLFDVDAAAANGG
jgi:hypothetical protein